MGAMERWIDDKGDGTANVVARCDQSPAGWAVIAVCNSQFADNLKNARMFLAAEELLAALQDALEVMEDEWGICDCEDADCEQCQARATILKATGKGD
jgi:hypothetical protein